MKRSRLIESISRAIMRDPDISSGGIVEGRLGVAAFLLAYAGRTGEEAFADRGGKLLRATVNELHSLPKGLLRGKWGIIPVLRFLLKEEMVTLSDAMIKMLENIREEEFFIYGCVPVKICMEDPLLSDAVIMRDMHEIINDPLKRLEYRERLISFVEECGYLLKESHPPVFCPEMLSECQLHSMAWFLGYAYRERFYPYKTLELACLLYDFVNARGFNNDVHGMILRRIISGDTNFDSDLNDDEQLNQINEAGYYAWLYRDESILDCLLNDNRVERIIHRLDAGEIGWREMLGIGLGLLADNEDKGLFRSIMHSEEFLEYNKKLKVNEISCEKNINEEACSSLHPASLSELTFCIPVRIDSPERLRNLHAVVEYFHKSSDANFIVLEADSCPRVELPVDSRIDYLFVEDKKEIYHRTRYINMMLKRCTTRFAAVWDADVVVPVGQIEEALEILKNEKSVMVYPYGGRLRNTMEFFSNCFARSLDIRVLSDFPQNSLLMCAYHSVGGGFIVDRVRYMSFGGENENFTGWGPEDVERWKRLEIIGETPKRTKGEMYHLSHPRGINSRAKDPETMLCTRTELAKVCGMMPNELREYIKTFFR